MSTLPRRSRARRPCAASQSTSESVSCPKMNNTLRIRASRRLPPRPADVTARKPPLQAPAVPRRGFRTVDAASYIDPCSLLHLGRRAAMSQQALDAFKTKLAEDEALRKEMAATLSAGGTKNTASMAEV